jgi:hypothetical protein
MVVASAFSTSDCSNWQESSEHALDKLFTKKNMTLSEELTAKSHKPSYTQLARIFVVNLTMILPN